MQLLFTIICLRFILPVAVGFVTLVAMLERYYGLSVSVVGGLVVTFLAFHHGAACARSIRYLEQPGQSLGLAGRITLLYAAVVGAAFLADVVVTNLQTLVAWVVAPIIGVATFLVGSAVLLGAGSGRACFLRGRKLIEYAEAVQQAAKLLLPGDAGIYWGGLRLPSDAAVSHFCVVGATGSGKTITLRLLMQSVLSAVGQQKDTRALIYDAKQDIISLLYGMGLSCDIRILNPFDARSWAWDMAKDVDSPALAAQIATTLIPPEDGSNRFFTDAAQHLLTGVLVSFIRSGKAWTLRDALLAMGDAGRLRAVLDRDPQARGLVAKYFENDRLIHDIISTASSKTMLYEPIAAVWDRAASDGRMVSLKEWAAGSFILVLGNDEAVRAPMDAINRVLFQRASELLLAATESTSRRSWVFLDEVSKAGKLEGLDSLLTKGRSKGACVVLGFQDIESLRDPRSYGEKVAHALVGQCANKAILRLDSEPTARWASGLIGEYEAREVQTSETTSNSGWSESISEQVVRREAVLATELLCLPQANGNGFHGYYITPLLGVYPAKVDFASLICGRGQVEDFIPRPVEEQYLRPWSGEDEDRLGFSIPTGGPPSPVVSDRPLGHGLDDIPRMTRTSPAL